MPGTIGIDSTTDLGGVDLTAADPHVLMSEAVTFTYTPSVNENVSEVGFHATIESVDGMLEVGVYRTDTLARIITANVSNTGDGRFTTAVSASLLAGVEYAVAFRVVDDVGVYRAYTEPAPSVLSALDGASPLANPFNPSAGAQFQRYAVFATAVSATAAASLSAPTPSGTLGTQTTANIGATTDQASGTAYCVLSTNNGLITGIDADQVIAADLNNDSPAPFSGDVAVSDTTPEIAITGLTQNTTYFYAIAQNNVNGNSNVVTGSFTTAAALRTVTLTLKDGSGALYNAKELNFWTRTTLQAAATDGGAGGLEITCNGVGEFLLDDLTIAAGAGWVTVVDPADDMFCANYPVTFTI